MGFAKKTLFDKPQNLASNTQPHSWFLSKKTNASLDLGGQVLGVYDDLYKPKAIAALPTGDGTGQSTDAAAATAADRIRRIAKRAAGLDSTIRTSPAGATLYSAQPKALLGS